MGKSPGKWIKSVLLGKKSTKSGSTKVNESVRTSIKLICSLGLFPSRICSSFMQSLFRLPHVSQK